MMLDHLGHPEAAAAIITAIETVLRDSDVKTPDMGGKATTQRLGAEIVAALPIP
jgi:tartrate dehydrogenase/decarboxylase/D-malate dehydrogenase